MKLTISHVKFYQGVKVGGISLPSVSIGESLNKQIIEVSEHERGVLIVHGENITLATWNNIQYINYKREEEKRDLKSALDRNSRK